MIFNIWFDILFRVGIFRGKITKKEFVKYSYFSYFLSCLMDMFSFGNKPDSLDIDLLMFYKLVLGAFGVKKDDDNYIVCRLTRGEGLLPNGLPEHYNLFTFNDTHFNKCKDKKDFVLGWNNKTKTSEFIRILDFAKLCNNSEITEKAILQYARLFNIYQVADERQKQEVISMINKSEDGFAYSIVIDGEKWDKSLKDDNSFIAHKLYDNDSIRGLGYTSTYFNEVIKRFFFFYGLPMSNGTKQAQQSVEEVTSNYSASSVYCKQLLECMKDFVDNFNTLYNESMTVDFSESWLESMNAIRNLDNDGDIDFSQLKKESDSNVDTKK